MSSNRSTGDQELCECRCGYSCDRKCGLIISECLAQGHYVQDCTHRFDGKVIEFDNGFSMSCSKCGALQISHDMMVGP